jgi:hypothetical protein
VSASSLAIDIDELYQRAVQDPKAIEEAFLVEWLERMAEATAHDRQHAKAIRRALRISRKLAAYWAERDSSQLPDWRHGVDELLGGRGWQAQLDIVMSALEVDPDPELFEEAKRRNRAVNFTEWMEGVGYEEWLGERSAPAG